MIGYFRTAKKKRMNKTHYSSSSSLSTNSRGRRIMKRKHKTSRKGLRSGNGVRIRPSKKRKFSTK